MKLAALLLAAVLLVGCGNPTTVAVPAGPNSPQTQVANLDKTLADAINAAVKITIVLRDQGKVSQGNTAIIENWCKFAALLADAIASELGSADPWSTQKSKILILIANRSLPKVTGALDPGAQAAINTVVSIFDQITGAVQ